MVDPIHEHGSVFELTALCALFELPAVLRKRLGTQRRTVRLQRMRRPSEVVGVLLVEGVAERREKPWRVGEERVDHLCEKSVAAEFSQSLDCARLEADAR